MKLKEEEQRQLISICKERRECEIDVPDSILGFSCLKDSDFKTPLEVSPTSTSFLEETFVQLILHSSQDLKGAWMRFVLFVYASGGKIFFTKLDSDNYRAKIVWPKS